LEGYAFFGQHRRQLNFQYKPALFPKIRKWLLPCISVRAEGSGWA